MWSSILVWGLGILAPIFVLLVFSLLLLRFRLVFLGFHMAQCRLYTGGGPHLGAGRDVSLRLSRCIPAVSR